MAAKEETSLEVQNSRVVSSKFSNLKLDQVELTNMSDHFRQLYAELSQNQIINCRSQLLLTYKLILLKIKMQFQKKIKQQNYEFKNLQATSSK